jgi:hypothetical protein
MKIDIDENAKQILLTTKEDIKKLGHGSATYSEAIRHLARKHQ